MKDIKRFVVLVWFCESAEDIDHSSRLEHPYCAFIFLLSGAHHSVDPMLLIAALAVSSWLSSWLLSPSFLYMSCHEFKC